MHRQSGSTLFELMTVLAVGGILAGVAIPGVGATRRTLAGDAGARKLALVLRAAQSRAQAHATTVTVAVAGNGVYTVHEAGSGARHASRSALVASGALGTDVGSNYSSGAVEFGPRGWPRLPGSVSPRAGTFTVGGDNRVVLQLGGCIRCR